MKITKQSSLSDVAIAAGDALPKAGIRATQVTRKGATAPASRRTLARVEARLRAHPPAGLTATQRRARATTLDRLAAYRRAGVFPHNHNFAARRVPYFVDAHGTRCAMAYLIEAAGGRDVVRAVCATANNARVVELAASPGIAPFLGAWLAKMGITVAEAQAIQPAYGYEGWRERPAYRNISRAQAMTAAFAGTAAVGSTVAILLKSSQEPDRKLATVIGLASGAALIGMGGAHVGDPELASNDLGIFQICLGAISVGVVGATALHRKRDVTRSEINHPEGAKLAFAGTAQHPLAMRVTF